MNLPESKKIDTTNDVNLRRLIAGAKAPRQCEHIKANGEFCGSPALRGRHYCYFHLTHIGRRLHAERVHAQDVEQSVDAGTLPLELPPFEDASSIQIALMQVVDAILHGRLDSKRAGLVLYALQTASSNLSNGAVFEPSASATVAARYEDFEQDFQLGDDVPELKADQAEEEQADNAEHAAQVAKIEELAAAYSKLDTAEEEASEREPEEGVPGKPHSAFQCNHVDKFFCGILGPLSKFRGACAEQPAQRHEREVISQKLGRSLPRVA